MSGNGMNIKLLLSQVISIYHIDMKYFEQY